MYHTTADLGLKSQPPTSLIDYGINYYCTGGILVSRIPQNQSIYFEIINIQVSKHRTKGRQLNVFKLHWIWMRKQWECQEGHGHCRFKVINQFIRVIITAVTHESYQKLFHKPDYQTTENSFRGTVNLFALKWYENLCSKWSMNFNITR